MSLERVLDVFTRVREAPSADRTRVLDEACGDDATLRAEVESLLAARDGLGDFLETPALAPTAFKPGDRVGGYEIVRELGRGGSGTVYEAWQSQPRRTVALKIVRARANVEQFRAEAEILARLKHPGVAHVYEAGVHEGRFYVVLEYVEGARPLTEAAMERDPRARIELLERVGEAVHHGHQKGVIHCDLKPGNVLVDESGAPKVIDFGIARLAGEQGPRARAGTLPYMSPEQIEPDNSAPDVRSDVYALGVLLRELVPGGSRDVVAIADKATRPARAGRYASAAAFSADLRRFLEHRPVEARAGGLYYHARRFARRHRVTCALLVSLVVVSVAAAIVGGGLALENARAREVAERKAYVANLAAAHAALRDHDLAGARRRLLATPIRLRGWEWSYVAAGVDQSARRIEVTEGKVRAAYAPDGDRIVAACGDWYENRATIRAFDAATGRETASRAVAGWTWTPSFTSDGLVAWGTHAGDVTFADPTTLEPVREFAFPDESAVRLDARAGLCITVGEGGVVRLRRLSDGAIVQELAAASREVSTAALTTDGRRVALGADGFVDLWRDDMRTRLADDRPASALAFADDGRLAIGFRDGAIEVESRAVRAPAGDPATVLAFAPTGDVVSGHESGTIRVWQAGGVRTHIGHEASITSLRFHPGTGALLSGAADRTMRSWAGHTVAPQRLLAALPRIACEVAYAPDGGWLAAACFDGAVRIFDCATGATVRTLRWEDEDEWVSCVVVTPDGRHVIAGANDQKLRFWNAATGALAATVATDGRPLSIALGGIGGHLACGDTENVLTIRDADTGASVHRFEQASWVLCNGYSHDGAMHASTERGHVIVRDVRNGYRRLRTIAEHGAATIETIAFHPNARRLAVGTRSGHVTVWDADTGVRIAVTRFLKPVAAVTYSPDGRLLVAASGTDVHVLAATTGESLLTLRQGGPALAAAFAPDGSQLATAGGRHDGRHCAVRLWGRTPGLAWPPRLD